MTTPTNDAKTYAVNEVFHSLQGEGIRAGTANVFVRFAGCNLRCRLEAGPKSPGGFDCDTEFAAARPVTFDQLYAWAWQAVTGETPDRTLDAAGKWSRKWELARLCEWWILTGGEPALQADLDLVMACHRVGIKLAIETNGSVELATFPPAIPDGLPSRAFDWITVSPKVAEHAVRQRTADEVKYVRGYGQPIPRPACEAKFHLISPAAVGDRLDPAAVQWCAQLVKENPSWRLSPQLHKVWRLR